MTNTIFPVVSAAVEPARPGDAAAVTEVPFEGFNFSRAQDPSTSAKDAFAYAVRHAPPPPGEDKQALEIWFEQYIQPQMEAFGHRIDWVQGDKMGFTSTEGSFTVDYLRGAGAPGWAVAWQADAAGVTGTAGNAASGAPADYDAFMQRLSALVSPDAGREDMEAAIHRAARDTGLPYLEVYKESIRLPGLGWVDLVAGYGGGNGRWQWMEK